MNKSCFTILFVLLQSTFVFGQSFLDSIRTSFESNAVLMQEKIYVHTDKDVYFSGETMWFKIYEVDASYHQFFGLSKVAYVEILSTDHERVVQLKVELREGTGEGYIDIPSSVSSGNYIFRAYSAWMKNFPADYFFE